MQAVRVLADDLTGACDMGAELLPWPGGVAVQPACEGREPVGRHGLLWVRNTQSRTLAPDEAARRVTAALGDAPPGWTGLVLKKIDTGLRGQLGAEIDAAMDVLDVDEAFVLPAIPEVGRTTQQGRQMIGGVPVHQTAFARDPQNPIHDDSVPAAIEATGRRRTAVIGLGAVRDGFGGAVDGARAAGAQVLVCDAETDADLERAVRGLLLRGRPLLLVGSTGLARALRRVLGAEQAGRPRLAGPPPASGTGVLVVAGSAHPATRAQIERAAGRGLLEPLVVADPADAESAGLAAGRLLRAGRWPALVAPSETLSGGSGAVLGALRRAALAAMSRVRPGGLALVGGETAYQVLEGLGHPALWLESRLCPLVVRARLMSGPYAGLALVTKGGSAGAADLLGAIVRQLGHGLR
jgi:uncharacterized protein YgbK (DUF1537 family)